MEKSLILYVINVNTLHKPLMTMAWAKSQRVALKDTLKKLFDRRGVKYLTMDGKEFDTPTHFMNYVTKHKKMDLVCKPYDRDEVNAQLTPKPVEDLAKPAPVPVKPDLPPAPPTPQ